MNFFIYFVILKLFIIIYFLFRKSLDTVVFPEYVKINAVMLIFKTSDVSNVSNYRPISILNHTGKLFEAIV